VTIYDRLTLHKEEILAIAARNGARNVRVFGSVVRREADEKSALDLLVEMLPGRTLFDVGGLAYELTELLGCSVDVVIEGGLRGVTVSSGWRTATTAGDQERT